MTREEYLLQAAAYAKRGNDLPQARLTPEKVREIRANVRGLFAWQLAMVYGVHIRTIDKIRTFQTWKHVR